MAHKFGVHIAKLWKRSKAFVSRWSHHKAIDAALHEDSDIVTRAAAAPASLGTEPPVAEHVTLSPIIQDELEDVLRSYQQEQARIYKQIRWPSLPTPNEVNQEGKPRTRWVVKTKRRLKKAKPQPVLVPRQAVTDAFAAGMVLQSNILKLLALNDKDSMSERPVEAIKMRELRKWDDLPLPICQGDSTLDTYWMARQDSGLLDGLMNDADEDFEEWQAEREMFLDQGYTLDSSHEDMEQQYLAYRKQLDAEYEAAAARVDKLHQQCLDEGINPLKADEEESKEDNSSLLKQLRANIGPHSIEQAIASGRLEHEVIPSSDQQEDDCSMAEALTLDDATSNRIADWLEKDVAPDPQMRADV